MTKPTTDNLPDGEGDRPLTHEEQLAMAAKITKRVPPPPPPTADQRSRWDRILTGLDSDRPMKHEDHAFISVIMRNVSSLNTWAWIRDLVIIIMLVVILGTLVWRSLLTEKRLDSCAAIGQSAVMTRGGTDNGR